MCRPLFADPELPNKLASGRYDDIAPCTRCSTCQKTDGLPKVCRVNAALGTVQYEIKEAEKKKSVVVIGGGPGGMEAARVAALRGHRVQLVEKTHKLGGSLPVAAVVKGLEIENLLALTRYLERQIVKLGVKVKTGQDLNLPLIDEMKPDVLIIATGGIPSVPEIPGINRPTVVNAAELHKTLKFFLRFLHPGTIRWFTKLWMPVGNKVVVIGGLVAACQLAEFLVKRGRKVTIVNSGPTLGDGLVPERRTRLFSWFRRKGVVMMTDVIYNEITDKGLTVTTKDGKKVILEADAIIPATPMLLNKDLARYFEGKVPEIYLVGDCKEPRLIPDAIADGWRIGNMI
jgi:2,4-dienoyl-CoA reductase (NADPH2)